MIFRPSSRCPRTVPKINLRTAVRRPCRRTFVTTGLQSLSEGFLDLALALPYSPYIPPYSATIILTTVLSRILFTVPFSIWAKRRQLRLEEQALPALIEFRNVKAKEIADNMKYSGFRGKVDEFRDEHIRRLKDALKVQQRLLFKKFRCSPLPTMLVPAATQLPLFVLSSIFFGQVAQRPSPLDAESFLTLTSLARPDPTGVLPIALGLVTLGNVETAQWFVNPDKLTSEAKIQQANAQHKNASTGLRVRTVVQSSLRGFSVFRIVIASMVDGSVVLYWLTSATFGLLQSWVFNAWEARSARKMQNRRNALGSV